MNLWPELGDGGNNECVEMAGKTMQCDSLDKRY